MARSAGTRDGEGGLLGGLAAELGQLERAVTRQGERFAAVLEIGAAISSARDTDDLLKLVVDRLGALLDAEAASLFVYDEERRELWSKVLRGSSLQEIRVPAGTGLVGHVLQTGAALRLGDAYEDARFNPDVDRKSGFRTRSVLAAPLQHASGKVLGVLEVLDRKVDAFSEEDLALVRAVAAQVAAVLENVRLYEQLAVQNSELELLYEVERAISSTETEAELLEHILAKATSVLHAPAASVLLCDEEQGALYFKSARGERSEGLTGVRLPSSQGIAGHVARTGETVRLEDAAQSAQHDKALARKLGLQVKSVLCVPIPGERRILGALELLNKEGGFTAADERLATLLAGQTGRAILSRQARAAGERRARMEAIGQMLAGVVHDLRTPLTVIGGYAQLISLEDDEKQRKATVDVIEKQLEHVNAMMRETLAFARGERSVLRRKLYLQHFLKEVGEYLTRDMEGSGVELKVVPNFTGAIRADETKLKRLVYNVARNAVQAMPDGGRFTLTAEKEDGQLVLRLADTGPGIPEEIAGTLFQSFVTSGKKEGTGLGLAIVKTIAEEHGGTVEFQSKAGKGTTFIVRLPVLV